MEHQCPEPVRFPRTRIALAATGKAAALTLLAWGAAETASGAAEYLGGVQSAFDLHMPITTQFIADSVYSGLLSTAKGTTAMLVSVPLGSVVARAYSRLKSELVAAYGQTRYVYK